MKTVSLSCTPSGGELCTVTVTTCVVRETVVMVFCVCRFRSTIPIDPIPPGVEMAQFKCGSTAILEFGPVLMLTGPSTTGGVCVTSSSNPYGRFLSVTSARPLTGLTPIETGGCRDASEGGFENSGVTDVTD